MSPFTSPRISFVKVATFWLSPVASVELTTFSNVAVAAASPVVALPAAVLFETVLLPDEAPELTLELASTVVVAVVVDVLFAGVLLGAVESAAGVADEFVVSAVGGDVVIESCVGCVVAGGSIIVGGGVVVDGGVEGDVVEDGLDDDGVWSDVVDVVVVGAVVVCVVVGEEEGVVGSCVSAIAAAG